MPRRKKMAQSPARSAGGPPEGGSFGYNTGSDHLVANSYPTSSTEKERIVKSMQEMFSHLDPEVIYIVLSECDFKVEIAMDSLLELHVAAEGAASPSVSGFERTTAALLSSEDSPENRHSPGEPHQPNFPSLADSSTENLDLLIDQELEALCSFREEEEGDGGLSSFPPLPAPQQALPELLQSSLDAGCRKRLNQQQPGTSSPINQHRLWGNQIPETQRDVLDFTHLLTETSPEEQKPSLELGASGRLSAFQVYKKQETHTESPASSSVSGPKSEFNSLVSNPHSYGLLPWNLEAPAFSPRSHGNQNPCFITPVAYSPSVWTGQSRLLFSPPRQQHPGHFAAFPRPWVLPVPPRFTSSSNKLRLQGRVLVLLRGAPGSGKSTLARAFLEQNPGGAILSTDDYFLRNGEYRFDPTVLGEAHEWNHKRAKEAFERGTNPIIIDNTNMQGWEMKPYVAQALKHGYKVLFKEPDTWWKNKPRELERRTAHNVALETIRRMLGGYERYVTVQSIMGTLMPERKQHILQENKTPEPQRSDASCPDLIGQPELREGCKKSHQQLFSSLPDLSSLSFPREVMKPDHITSKSTESLNLKLYGKPTRDANISEEHSSFDLGELDSELDLQSELNAQTVEQGIPDCIVESVMNEENAEAEMSVALTGSIAQRVKRERPSRRSDFEAAMKNADRENPKAEEAGCEETGRKVEEQKTLQFVGDWPSAGSMKQRQGRKREGNRETPAKAEEEKVSGDERAIHVQSGPDMTEFQKLIDLIQTGILTAQTDSPENPDGDFEREDEAGGVFEEPCDSGPKNEDKQQNQSQLNSRKPELPDCVLDGNAADIIELKTDKSKGLKAENEMNSINEGSVTIPETEMPSDSFRNDQVGGVPAVQDSCYPDVGVKVCPDNDAKAESDRNLIAEPPQSPECDSFVETGSSGGSQEKKPRRRSGKLCKLALSFPQSCPASSSNDPQSSDSTAEAADGEKTSIRPVSNPQSNTRQDEEVSDPLLNSPAPIETGSFVQTEPQDFARLWRFNRHGDGNDRVTADGSHSEDYKILFGNSSRFVPELSSAVSAAVAVDPSGHTEVADHVVHEKSTQVEEKDLGVTQDRLQSLRILSRHFKLVSFDTLEDLYEKCHQDLEWTTNLLLDSGERFFKDEDEELEKVCEADIEDNLSSLCGDSCENEGNRNCINDLDEEELQEQLKSEQSGVKETCEIVNKPDDMNIIVDVCGAQSAPGTTEDQPDAASDLENHSHADVCPPKTLQKLDQTHIADLESIFNPDLEGGAFGGSWDQTAHELLTEDDAANMDEIHRLLQAELEEMEREEKQRQKRRGQHLDIQSVELKLPTELALQLTELFGPVGVEPGTCLDDDFTVQMDLNLAKQLHQKWKETIQEKQKQANLSLQLLQQSFWGQSQGAKHQSHFLTSRDAAKQPDSAGQTPFTDHWSISHPPVSLRDIMKEEQALENVQKSRQSRIDPERRDGATLLKEKQLYSMFPTIDRHFLQDIFKEHNYNLSQTELFLRSLLNEEPVKTVFAPEVPRSDHYRAASKEREKRQKTLELAAADYQDTQDPEYEDFRAEASLQRSRQLESFAKAAEAYKQGRKEVASFYAQQGHLHGQRMREANHRAAVHIFEKVNSSLLPRNILDLHGLHVNEALEHLAQILQEKTAECAQGLCQPQLSVITGRGNHSQGGVARIRPAVIDYLTNKHYRFTEPKPGLVLVSLK
ncbi:NEDD4-binding protein 2 [Oryzias melastigma]|uniref:NEDD4-binding protein 2 n=1 Tax=Oryzias melastigma TaxID=30732 RepID=A0A834CQA2_ORYME|nr:NEDD4-binding protein 2 [Oryzias melastigma]